MWLLFNLLIKSLEILDLPIDGPNGFKFFIVMIEYLKILFNQLYHNILKPILTATKITKQAVTNARVLFEKIFRLI